MVIRLGDRRRAWLMFDVALAIALLLVAFLPLAYSFSHERKLARICYWRAVAIEIVDGEFEALTAGEWRRYAPGTHDYPVNARAAANLPPGQFILTVSTNTVRLEWTPKIKRAGGAVVREARV